MNLEAIGRRVLPWVAAALEDVVDYLLAAQLYVERWQRLLDGGEDDLDRIIAESMQDPEFRRAFAAAQDRDPDSYIDLDAVADAL